MEVRHLGNTKFEVIMECFLLAFNDYFVKMPTDHKFYQQRWKAAGVRYDLSFGMFNGNKLVGFIINAIDNRQGHLTAYNAGTGVISEYRGQRIVKSIYEYAIPTLIKNDITKCQLEVITENEKAIKSYKGIGFDICRYYKCFKGTLSTKGYNALSIKKISHDGIRWELFSNQGLYSWDNQKKSLAKGNLEYYQVAVGDVLQSYFIMNSESGYIAQFDVLEDTITQWENLFSAIQSVNKNVRINNIDERLTYKIKAVESVGLENTVDQIEMELLLETEPTKIK